MVGWNVRPVLTILPDELNDEEPPPTVPPTSSVQVYLELLTDNAAAGREAEEMLKIGDQCVIVSAAPGLVRNGYPPP